MAIILDKYAIKEVADVMFYELDKKGAPSAPVLYLDTLKVSTLEQSSETVDATGGKGNVKLLSWDTNKELTLTLEDALFSAKSLSIMFGGTMEWNGDEQEVLKTLEIKNVEKDTLTGGGAILKLKIKGQDFYIKPSLVTSFSYQNADGTNSTDPVAVATPDWDKKTSQDENQDIEFITFDLLDCTSTPTGTDTVVKNGMTIDIGAEFGSNTYYITGDTYARNYQSGQDEFLQFIVPKGKVSSEDVSLTMEADGDPATFSMSVKCLKSVGGSMIKLVKYDLTSGAGANTGLNKGVASVLEEYDTLYDKTKASDWATPHSIIGDGEDSKPIRNNTSGGGGTGGGGTTP